MEMTDMYGNVVEMAKIYGGYSEIDNPNTDRRKNLGKLVALESKDFLDFIEIYVKGTKRLMEIPDEEKGSESLMGILNHMGISDIEAINVLKYEIERFKIKIKKELEGGSKKFRRLVPTVLYGGFIDIQYFSNFDSLQEVFTDAPFTEGIKRNLDNPMILLMKVVLFHAYSLPSLTSLEEKMEVEFDKLKEELKDVRIEDRKFHNERIEESYSIVFDAVIKDSFEKIEKDFEFINLIDSL